MSKILFYASARAATPHDSGLPPRAQPALLTPANACFLMTAACHDGRRDDDAKMGY